MRTDYHVHGHEKFNMIKKRWTISLALISLIALLNFEIVQGQMRTTSVQQLNLGTTNQWGFPQFAPDGRSVYFTTASYDGIWNYSISSGEIRQITSDPRSGYGFAVSRDGQRLAYRRTTINQATKERLQEIVVVTLLDGKSEVIRSSGSLSIPLFIDGSIITSDDMQSQIKSSSTTGQEVVVGGIEDTKIVLFRERKKQLFDPFGNGRYIWPMLSPQEDRIVAYELSRGTFVCDLSGIVLSQLGRRNAPVWTRDGKWIVYMDDRDDGHQITSSDIYAISREGKQISRLTSTEDTIEMFPNCSPTENKIVFATLRGEIFILSYEEAAR